MSIVLFADLLENQICRAFILTIQKKYIISFIHNRETENHEIQVTFAPFNI